MTRCCSSWNRPARAAIGKRVTVVEYPNGRLAILYNGIELAYRTFYKIRQVDQGAIIENKRLGAALSFIREQQLRRGSEHRSGPRRRDQRDARLFKAGGAVLRAERTAARLVKTIGAISRSRSSGAGRALRCAGGLRATRRPTPLTSVNGTDDDFSIRWTQLVSNSRQISDKRWLHYIGQKCFEISITRQVRGS